MDNQHCYSLQGSVPPECINTIWKSQGCTVAPNRALVQGLSASQLREKAEQAANSKDKEEWQTCFGSSSQSGFGSNINFEESVMPSGCSSKLDSKGDIIYCEECNQLGDRNGEGIWLFKEGKRVWIPSCHCRSAVVAAELPSVDNYNICGGKVPVGKKISKIGDSCQLMNSWRDTEAKWFHSGKGIVDGIDDDDTIFYSSKGSDKVHTANSKTCKYTCNGQEFSICDLSKVKSCRDNNTECQQAVLTQKNSKVQPKNIPAKCWYSIPIMNGSGNERSYMLGKDQVKIKGLDCSDSQLFNFSSVDGSLYLGDTKDSLTANENSNTLFIFKGKKYWKLSEVGDNFKVPRGKEEKGKLISDDFPGLPYPIDACCYNHSDKKVYFFKDHHYYTWDFNKQKIAEQGEITSKWSGVPDKVDLVISTFGALIFFKDSFYYKAVNPMVLCPSMIVASPWFCITCPKNGWVLEIDTQFTNWDKLPGSSLKGGYLRGKPKPHQQFYYDSNTKVIVNPHSGFCIGIQNTVSGKGGGVTMLSRIPKNDGSQLDLSNMEWGLGQATDTGKTVQCKNHILTISDKGVVSAKPIGGGDSCKWVFGIPGEDWTGEKWQNYPNCYISNLNNSDACLQLTPIGKCSNESKIDNWWITSGVLRKSGISDDDAVKNVGTCTFNSSPGLNFTSSLVQWTYKNNPTGVGSGYWSSACDNKILTCSGGDTNGAGDLQAKKIKEAIDHGNNSNPKGNYWIGKDDGYSKKLVTPHAWKKYWGWKTINSTPEICPVSVGKRQAKPYQQWIFVASRGALQNPASGFYLSCNPGTFVSTSPGGSNFNTDYKLVYDTGHKVLKFVYKDGTISVAYYKNKIATDVYGPLQSGNKINSSSLGPVAGTLNSIGAGYKWNACIDTEYPNWLNISKVTLLSGMPKGNPFRKQNTKHPLKGESINSWEDAVNVAESMGTRPISMTTFMMAFRSNQDNTDFPKNISGWVGKNHKFSSGLRVKIGSDGNLIKTEDSDSGVWVYDNSSQLTYMGKGNCGSTPYPCTTDKNICKSSCLENGNCWKNEKCYPMRYTSTITTPKPIARLFNGMPDYLDSGFCKDGKFVAIKKNQVYIFDGENTSPESIKNMFVNYPLTKNILAEVESASTKEQIMEDTIYQHEKAIQHRNLKLMKRGEEALALSQQVINDQELYYNKNENNIGNLEKGIYSNLRQTSMSDTDDRKHRAKIYYLRAILIFSIIQGIVFLGLKALGKRLQGTSTLIKLIHKLTQKRNIVIVIITVIFVIYLTPRLISDLQMSRLRWGMKQWIQPFAGDNLDSDEPSPTGDTQENSSQSQLAKKCKAMENKSTS